MLPERYRHTTSTQPGGLCPPNANRDWWDRRPLQRPGRHDERPVLLRGAAGHRQGQAGLRRVPRHGRVPRGRPRAARAVGRLGRSAAPQRQGPAEQAPSGASTEGPPPGGPAPRHPGPRAPPGSASSTRAPDPSGRDGIMPAGREAAVPGSGHRPAGRGNGSGSARVHPVVRRRHVDPRPAPRSASTSARSSRPAVPSSPCRRPPTAVARPRASTVLALRGDRDLRVLDDDDAADGPTDAPSPLAACRRTAAATTPTRPPSPPSTARWSRSPSLRGHPRARELLRVAPASRASPRCPPSRRSTRSSATRSRSSASPCRTGPRTPRTSSSGPASPTAPHRTRTPGHHRARGHRPAHHRPPRRRRRRSSRCTTAQLDADELRRAARRRARHRRVRVRDRGPARHRLRRRACWPR